MMRKVAAWYALLVGVTLPVLPFLVDALHANGAPGNRVRTALFIVAGLLLATGAIARLARFPGRVASYYLGLGAGGMTLLSAVPYLLSEGAPIWQPVVAIVAVVGLIGSSWAVWPSGS